MRSCHIQSPSPDSPPPREQPCSNILPSNTGSVIDPIDKSIDMKDDEVIFVDQQISNDSLLHINIDSVLLNGSESLTSLNMINASRLLQAQFKGYNIMFYTSIIKQDFSRTKDYLKNLTACFAAIIGLFYRMSTAQRIHGTSMKA